MSHSSSARVTSVLFKVRIPRGEEANKNQTKMRARKRKAKESLETKRAFWEEKVAHAAKCPFLSIGCCRVSNRHVSTFISNLEKNGRFQSSRSEAIHDTRFPCLAHLYCNGRYVVTRAAAPKGLMSCKKQRESFHASVRLSVRLLERLAGGMGDGG